jgi:hypothetical protein
MSLKVYYSDESDKGDKLSHLYTGLLSTKIMNTLLSKRYLFQGDEVSKSRKIEHLRRTWLQNLVNLGGVPTYEEASVNQKIVNRNYANAKLDVKGAPHDFMLKPSLTTTPKFAIWEGYEYYRQIQADEARPSAVLLDDHINSSCTSSTDKIESKKRSRNSLEMDTNIRRSDGINQQLPPYGMKVFCLRDYNESNIQVNASRWEAGRISQWLAHRNSLQVRVRFKDGSENEYPWPSNVIKTQLTANKDNLSHYSADGIVKAQESQKNNLDSANESLSNLNDQMTVRNVTHSEANDESNIVDMFLVDSSDDEHDIIGDIEADLDVDSLLGNMCNGTSHLDMQSNVQLLHKSVSHSAVIDQHLTTFYNDNVDDSADHNCSFLDPYMSTIIANDIDEYFSHTKVQYLISEDCPQSEGDSIHITEDPTIPLDDAHALIIGKCKRFYRKKMKWILKLSNVYLRLGENSITGGDLMLPFCDVKLNLSNFANEADDN